MLDISAIRISFEVLRWLLYHDFKQLWTLRDRSKLIPEGNDIACFIFLELIWEKCLHFFSRFKPDVKWKFVVLNLSAICLVFREISDSERGNHTCCFSSLLWDWFLSTGIHMERKAAMEGTRKEIEALSWLKAHISHMIDWFHSISQELNCKRRS